MGHLGSRTSALLDGQLSAEETERAWEHVHGCHVCRDLVEREGWIKSRLTGLSFDVAAPATPTGLKASLIGATPGESYLVAEPDRRRTVGIAAIGGSAVGAAVMGVLVLGVGPASAPAPSIDRRAPVTSVVNTEAPRPVLSQFVTRQASISPDGSR